LEDEVVFFVSLSLLAGCLICLMFFLLNELSIPLKPFILSTGWRVDALGNNYPVVLL